MPTGTGCADRGSNAVPGDVAATLTCASLKAWLWFHVDATQGGFADPLPACGPSVRPPQGPDVRRPQKASPSVEAMQQRGL